MQKSTERIIAAYIHKNTIGLCYFDPERVRLQCSEISSLCCVGYPMIRNKFSKCTHLITNCLTHEIFASLDSEAIQISVVGDKTMDEETIQVNLGKISQHLSSVNNFKTYFQQYATTKCKFYALGLMLNHLLREHGPLSLKDKLFIEDVEYFIDTLFELVQIDKTAIQFLEISRQDLHPSLIKGKGASKEGYSLISAYQSFLISTGSKKILRYLFMNPTYNRQILEQRWELIGWMRENMSEAARYQKHFRNIHAMEAIIKKFGRNHAEEEVEWKKLMKTLQAMLELRRLLSLQDMPKLVQEYVNHESWDQIVSIYDIFRNAIEFEPLGLRHGIDSTLDQLKKTYDNMPHLLTLIAREQDWDLDFRIVFMTQVGYLIKLSNDVELPSTFDPEDWILQFSNNSGKYYSNGLTHMLDNEYGDVYGQIQDIQKKIIFDLQTMVVESEQIFLHLYWKISQIECFWGVSQLSRNMCRPKLSSQALIVSNGWHMLLSGNVIHNHNFSFCQSQAPKNYIYNSQQNLVNTNYSNRCTLITGPNASGKTVYMKQLGIIVFLAHLGFYVPASFAEIPLCDSIKFVEKTGSIYNDQRCGFEAELKSLGSILQPNVISNKALILIDELGAQIDYQNSLRLLYATVDYLTNKQVKFLPNRVLSKKNDEFSVPMVIVVTHLSQILRGSILEQNYLIRFLTMSVEECGVRLFKIKPGLVAKGYGIRAAAEILPQSVIAASQKFMNLITKL